MIEIIKEWLKTNEILEKMDIRTDYLSPKEDKDDFSLEQNETFNPLKKGNVKGTKLIGTYNFTLAGRFDYSVHKNNINDNNLKLMQQISDWIVEKNLCKDYPVINEKEEIVGIELTSAPFLFGIDKSTKKARYEITFRVNYERKVERIWL